MSYDNPQREEYGFAPSAFGGATESQKMLGPKGKKGLVRDIITDLSADAVGTTTVPEVCIGVAAGTAEYGRQRLGTAVGAGATAAGGPYRASVQAASAQGNTGGVPPALNDFAGHVQLETAYIPADTPFYMTRKAGVGGAPAGTGRTKIVIDWF